MGRLKGYARRYTYQRDFDILAIVLKDSCGMFEVVFAPPRRLQKGMWEELDSFLADVQIRQVVLPEAALRALGFVPDAQWRRRFR